MTRWAFQMKLLIAFMPMAALGYYSPNVGRWTARDPLEEKGGVNLHAFCENDPVNSCDILGLKRWVMIYYSALGQPEFRRAAETAKRGVERQSGFDPKCDQVLMKGVTSADDFTTAWAVAARETDGSDPNLKVREAHLFTHSGPGKIYMRGGTVTAASIKQLPRLNWDVDGKVICHGCNSGIWDASGDSVAGNFAQGQSVLALGQTGFSQFSEREDRRTIFTRVGSDSQTVYLWSYGDGGQSWTFGDARPPRQFLPSGK